MEPLIMGENKNTDELSSIWRKRFINALKITTNNAETDQTARQIATLLINQKQSSTITKFWKQLKIDKTYESAQERLQNKKSIFKVNSQIDAPDILEVFRTYQTIQVTKIEEGSEQALSTQYAYKLPINKMNKSMLDNIIREIVIATNGSLLNDLKI
ncbi:10226_t:CDS:2 [Entrophospora sp. SA101]|nr:10226_t:CDS:2 [Entrophospora sp. SA101]